jgi:hypothetical protein
MYMKNIRKLFIVGVVVAVLLLAFGLMNRPDTPANVNSVFSLQAPPFVDVARAETGSAASIIEDEAGISAWFQAPTSINLDDVRDVFRTIEAETADYIIGSVPVPNYGEGWDVHVYVHKDGWILAYYLAGDPVGKIFDWIAYHNAGRTRISTMFESVMVVVADAAGVPFTTPTYYDFRYPNATHLMLIVEWVSSASTDDVTDSFEVKVPGSFAYYQRSWSLGSTGNDCARSWYKVNGEEIASHGWVGDWHWAKSQGTLTVSQLPSDQYRWIEVGRNGRGYGGCDAYGGLALVYRVP